MDDETIDVERLAACAKLATESKFPIVYERGTLFKSLAREILAEKGENKKQRVKTVAKMLYHLFRIVKKRSGNKELKEETIETELYSIIRQLVSDE